MHEASNHPGNYWTLIQLAVYMPCDMLTLGMF